jgi:hypothetical protein
MAVTTAEQRAYQQTTKAEAPRTAFDVSEQAFNEIHRLVARIEATVDKIAGTQPTLETSARDKPTGDGLLQDLWSKASAAQEAIERANDALGRLERSV